MAQAAALSTCGRAALQQCPQPPSQHAHGSSLSPWRPDARQLCRPAAAAASRRTLLQAAVVCAAGRPSRLNAATFQAPAVSFLPPASSTRPQQPEAPARTAAPKHHSGPPVFVQATGRIVASECLWLGAARLAGPGQRPGRVQAPGRRPAAVPHPAACRGATARALPHALPPALPPARPHHPTPPPPRPPPPRLQSATSTATCRRRWRAWRWRGCWPRTTATSAGWAATPWWCSWATCWTAGTARSVRPRRRGSCGETGVGGGA